MTNSKNGNKVENDFIEWCKSIHPDINPYIFIQRHSRYSNEYFPLLEDLMKDLHEELSKKVPNIHFSFKGRVKSKRSFLIKSFRTMAENIEKNVMMLEVEETIISDLILYNMTKWSIKVKI